MMWSKTGKIFATKKKKNRGSWWAQIQAGNQRDARRRHQAAAQHKCMKHAFWIKRRPESPFSRSFFFKTKRGKKVLHASQADNDRNYAHTRSPATFWDYKWHDTRVCNADAIVTWQLLQLLQRGRKNINLLNALTTRDCMGGPATFLGWLTYFHYSLFCFNNHLDGEWQSSDSTRIFFLNHLFL